MCVGKCAVRASIIIIIIIAITIVVQIRRSDVCARDRTRSRIFEYFASSLPTISSGRHFRLLRGWFFFIVRPYSTSGIRVQHKITIGPCRPYPVLIRTRTFIKRNKIKIIKPTITRRVACLYAFGRKRKIDCVFFAFFLSNNYAIHRAPEPIVWRAVIFFVGRGKSETTLESFVVL